MGNSIVPRGEPAKTEGLKPSQNIVLSKKRKLIRRRSYNANASSAIDSHSQPGGTKTLQRTPSKVLRIKLEPQKEIPQPKETTTPRKWLGWFASTDSNLRKEKKKNLKDGIESHKTISELTLELEETLEALGASYSFTNKRDRIKARITKGLDSILFVSGIK